MKRWWIIGAAVVVLLFVAAGGIIIAAKSGLRNFFYPTASSMPAQVTASTSEILAQLEKVLAAKAPHVLAGLQPGLTAEEIARLEKHHDVRLPDDLKALYQWHNGSRQDTNSPSKEFIPGHDFFPLETALRERELLRQQVNLSGALQKFAFNVFAGHTTTWIQLFPDGAGDGYFFDPARKDSDGAVFYHFSEDGTYTFYPSTRNLLASILKCYEQGAFRKKEGSDPPELEEDFEASARLDAEFGVRHTTTEE